MRGTVRHYSNVPIFNVRLVRAQLIADSLLGVCALAASAEIDVLVFLGRLVPALIQALAGRDALLLGRSIGLADAAGELGQIIHHHWSLALALGHLRARL